MTNNNHELLSIQLFENNKVKQLFKSISNLYIRKSIFNIRSDVKSPSWDYN